MQKARAIYAGYNKARKLTASEYEHLCAALHSVYLGIGLCGIDLLVQKKLPKHFIIWVLDNLFETEKNIPLNRKQFLNALTSNS
ncbi:MAG: hypothetical protein FJY98_04550 [Candidatus Liptonbacteria bacterium]|nr:hypothetical protein [Candidatus Liptonbacteria bacterium]